MFTSSVFVKWKCLCLPLFCFENKIYLEKIYCIFWLFTSNSSHSAWKTSKSTVSVWFLIHFSWEPLKSSHDATKTTHLKDGLFSWKISIPTLRDICVTTKWNDYKFFSMTQKILEIDVMVYSMSSNPKIYQKIFLVTVLKN